MGSPSPRFSNEHDPLVAGRRACGLQPAATFSCRGRPPSPSRPGLPAGASGRGPGSGRPPPLLPARGLVLPAAAGRSGSGRPFKLKPLSSPPPGPPCSACGRSAPPCPAPHRNESGRAARSAPPRQRASRPPKSARDAAAAAAAAAEGVMGCGPGAGQA